MPIILPLGRTVKAYLRLYGDTCPALSIACRKCEGATLHKHGRYWRTAVTRRQVYRVPIYRWKCPCCGATVSVLPDFLAPYAQFVSLVREGAVRRRLCGSTVAEIAASACCAAAGGLSLRSVYRWLAKARQKATDWTAVLTDRLLRMQPGADLFRLSPHWQGLDATLKALCGLGDLCRRQVPSVQNHPGLFAYCNGLSVGLPRL